MIKQDQSAMVRLLYYVSRKVPMGSAYKDWCRWEVIIGESVSVSAIRSGSLSIRRLLPVELVVADADEGRYGDYC